MKIIWYSVVRKDFFCHAKIGQLPFLLFPLCLFFYYNCYCYLYRYHYFDFSLTSTRTGTRPKDTCRFLHMDLPQTYRYQAPGDMTLSCYTSCSRLRENLEKDSSCSSLHDEDMFVCSFCHMQHPRSGFSVHFDTLWLLSFPHKL